MPKKHIASLLSLLFIVILFRLPVFFLSHNNNDELIHLALAKKIDYYGLNVFQKQEYNLFYIERVLEPSNQLFILFDGENRIGSLVEKFLGEKEILSHHPPALPFAIALSHKLFAGNFDFLISLSRNSYLMIKNSRLQFYACFIPFLFSLLLTFSTYFLGSLFFSHKIGWFSALFLSFTPIELLTANKIWADGMVAFFSVLAVILYLYSLKNDKPVFSLLAGLSCGVAIITKMSAVYIVFAVLLSHLIDNATKNVSIRNLLSFLLDKRILYFLAGVFIISAWWVNLYYLNFNINTVVNYFLVNQTSQKVKTWSSFFGLVSNRPWYSYFILVPFQSPIYLLSYIFIPLFILRNKIKSIEGFIGEKYRYLQFLIIWVVLVFLFLSLNPGKELRYMLIAYPAIAVLSAYCFNLFYELLKQQNPNINSGLIKTFFVSIILASLFFSLAIALPRVLLRADIIPIPL